MARPHLDDDQRRARMARRHHLAPATRTDDVAAITADLVALHASDPASVFLSAGARMRTPAIEAVEDALYEQRSILRHHAMRRTLWVMSPTTARRAHASSTAKVAAVERRRLLGLLAETPDVDDPEAWLADTTDQLVAEVAAAGAVTTREIGRMRPDLAVPIVIGDGSKFESKVAAHGRVLVLAAFEGRLVRTRPSAGWNSSEYLWSSTAEWIGQDIEGMERRTAAAELLGHWLERFGPGTEQDLRWWTGWTARDVRAALVDIEAVEVDLDGGATGWIAPNDTEVLPPAEPWVALLPSLDPTTMGWKGRDWYLDEDVTARVFDRNGNAGPTVWADGRIVGGWAQRADGEIALELLRDLDAAQTDALERAAGRITDLIGEVRIRVRFPSPNQPDLLS